MSELVLSTTQQNHYEYPTMVNINPELVNKSTNNNNHHENNNNNTHYTTTATTASTYPAYTFQSLPMGFTPVNSYPHHPTMSRMDYFDDPTTATTTNTAGRQSNSPESISSSSSPTPSPPPASSSIPLAPVVAASQVIETELITTTASTQQAKFNNPTTARVKEMINRATSVPMEFYHTEFLEYSKESYEKKTGTKRNKRKRTDQPDTHPLNNKRKKAEIVSDDDLDEVEEAPQLDNNNSHDISNMSDAEIRRQIHIQSEQKRRAQIKDGFDELRKHLPGCNNKKMSKAALLTRTVQQLQHLKGMQNELLSEVERLLQENESLKNVLQRQAMEKMYTF